MSGFPKGSPEDKAWWEARAAVGLLVFADSSTAQETNFSIKHFSVNVNKYTGNYGTFFVQY